MSHKQKSQGCACFFFLSLVSHAGVCVCSPSGFQVLQAWSVFPCRQHRHIFGRPSFKRRLSPFPPLTPSYTLLHPYTFDSLSYILQSTHRDKTQRHHHRSPSSCSMKGDWIVPISAEGPSEKPSAPISLVDLVAAAKSTRSQKTSESKKVPLFRAGHDST